MADAQPTVVPSVVVGEVEKDSNKGVAGAKRYFQELLPFALTEAKRILTMSTDEKQKWVVAKDVIELAGAGGGPKTAPVVINDSQVQLILQARAEALD